MDGIKKLTKNEFNQATAKHLDTYITYLNSCTWTKDQKL